MPKSNYAKQLVVDYLARNQATSQPTALYAGLFITNPTDSNVGTEIAYDGYERQAVTFTSPVISNGKASISNQSQISFATSDTNAGTIGFIGLFDTISSGNLIYYGPLSASYAINTGVQPLIAVGALVISEQ